MGGLLQVKNAQQLEQEDIQAKEQAQEANERVEVIDNLAAHVRSCWSAAKTHRSRNRDRLTNCLRLRKGLYSPSKLKEIHEQGGSDIYMNITGTKCAAAKAWITDLYSGSGDRPFTISPTPKPDLDPNIQHELISTALNAVMQTGVPPEVAEQLLTKHEERIKDEVMQESEQRMEGMADYIGDILTEGGYRAEFDAFVDDLCTYPYAILKGPIYRKERKVSWAESQDGSFMPEMTDKITRKFKRVSPFNFYPSPTMSKIGDSWHIEHIQFTPAELAMMRTSKGYSGKNITMALVDYRRGGLREWAFDTGEREHLEGKSSVFNGDYDMIDGLEFHGTIQGKQLVDWGIDYEIPDLYAEYSVIVTVIGGYTIRAAVNPDPTGKAMYYKATFRDVPGSFMGEALPEILEDTQNACNATARALINNMALGSGPQVAVDVSMLPKGQNPTSIRPHKLWLYASKQGQTKPGVSFFSPEIKANELLNVYERFERYADNLSGIPAYAYGSDNAAGAGKTASGLSMLMNAASKSIKGIVRNIDINVIEPLVANLYQSAMIDPDVPNDIKGDAQVIARGSDSLMHKEATAMRQIEFMNMTNNPTDMQIIGMKGRREMLEEASKTSEFPVGRVVPTLDDLMQSLSAQPQPEEGEQDAEQHA